MDDDTNQPIRTRPVRAEERFMQERLSEAVAEQSKLMSTLAQQLLTVELAIPGLYATALKLSTGSEQLTLTGEIYLAFSCWLISLLLTLFAMIPYLDREIVRNSPDSIEEFFHRAAWRKFKLLMPAMGFFLAGIIFILVDLL